MSNPINEIAAVIRQYPATASPSMLASAIARRLGGDLVDGGAVEPDLL